MREAFYFIVALACSFIIGGAFAGCREEDKSRQDFLARVDSVCGTDPEKAMRMLDSVKHFGTESEGDIRYKYLLLTIKARDKAFIPHTSDTLIKKVVAYYNDNGTANERMEAYYYMGSVYRDMHDSPNAIRYYLKAVDIASHSEDGIDTLTLSSLHSQISFVYFRLRDYRQALKFSVEENRLLGLIGKSDGRSLMDVAKCYWHLGRMDSARMLYRQALAYIEEHDAYEENADILAGQVSVYAQMGDLREAAKIVHLLDGHIKGSVPDNYYAAKAVYYQRMQQFDSAAVYYNKMLDLGLGISGGCDAARGLMEVYSKQGKAAEALKYANLYALKIDSLNIERQQDLTENVHNEYKYRRDLEAEAAAYKESSDMWRIAVIVLLVSVCLIALVFFAYLRFRNRVRRELSEKDLELQEKDAIIAEQKKDISAQEELIAQKETEIRKEASAVEENIAQIKQQDETLLRYKETIEQQRALIKKAKDENARLARIKLGMDISASRDEIIKKFKDAANNIMGVTIEADDWTKLMAAVNLSDPDFLDKMGRRLSRPNEKKIRICYLLKIGLSWSEIMVVADIPRSTAHRLTHSIATLLGDALREPEV